MQNINESIVLVGGGGGVYRVAKFLKHIRRNITTIQTVFDSGGHSGVLRDEHGVLPPGDIRQAILALSDDSIEPALRKLMMHRFGENGKSSLNKATVGNILLTALTEIEGSLPLAIKALSKICRVRGKVLPVSLDNAELCVELSDGSLLRGEGKIDTRSIDDDRIIARAYLEPQAHIFVDSYEAIVNADKIVFCPGDIYTSLVPNLLVKGFEDALANSKAKLIYCVNLMTKKAETHGFSVTQFVEVVRHYSGRRFDFVIYNDEPIDQEVMEEYAGEKCYPVQLTSTDKTLAEKWISANLFDRVDDGKGLMVRHHERIASIIADL